MKVSRKCGLFRTKIARNIESLQLNRSITKRRKKHLSKWFSFDHFTLKTLKFLICQFCICNFIIQGFWINPDVWNFLLRIAAWPLRHVIGSLQIKLRSCFVFCIDFWFDLTIIPNTLYGMESWISTVFIEC